MQRLKKTTLGLAVAAVSYGLAMTSVQAEDKTIDQGTHVSIDALGGHNHILGIGAALGSHDDENHAITITEGQGVLTNNGVINDKSAINHGSDEAWELVNTGLITGAIVSTGTDEALTFKNSGSYHGLITGGKAELTNTGTMVLVGGSHIGSGSLDTSDGELHISMKLNEAGNAFEHGVTTGNVGGSLAANENTVIKVSVDPSILRQINDESVQLALATLGNISDNSPRVIHLGDGAQFTGSEDYQLVSGNVLINIVDHSRADGLRVELELNDIEEVIEKIGMGEYAQKIAKKFQTGFNSNDIKLLEQAYGELVLNLATEDDLKAYALKVFPSNSSASADAGVDMTNAVSGNISSRTSSIRTGVAAGGLTEVDGYWIQGIYAESKQHADSSGLSQGYTGRLKGATLGVDREYGDITAGIAFSFNEGTTHFVNNPQEEQVRSYMGSLYGVWQQEDYYVDGSLSYGLTHHTNALHKGSVSAQTAEFDSIQIGAKLTTGYYFRHNSMTFEPRLASRFSHVNINGYQYYYDSDGAGSTSFGSASVNKFELGAGGFVTALWNLGNDVDMTPYLGVMYYRDQNGEKLERDITFASDSYTLQGTSPERDSKEVSVGFDIQSGNHMTFSAGLVKVLKDDFYSNNYTLKLRYDF